MDIVSLVRGQKTLEVTEQIRGLIEYAVECIKQYDERDKTQSEEADAKARLLLKNAKAQVVYALCELELAGYGCKRWLYDREIIRDLAQKVILDFWNMTLVGYVVREDRTRFVNTVYENAESLINPWRGEIATSKMILPPPPGDGL